MTGKMSAEQRRIFVLYLRIKKIDRGPPTFGSNDVQYLDEHRQPIKKSEILDSFDYKGFVDGVTGNPHHFSPHAHGSVKPDKRLGESKQRLGQIIRRTLHGREGLMPEIDRTADEAFIQANYDQGYQLDQKSRGQLLPR